MPGVEAAEQERGEDDAQDEHAADPVHRDGVLLGVWVLVQVRGSLVACDHALE
jgi:hypothetical protein